VQNQDNIQTVKRAFAAAFDSTPLPRFPAQRMSIWEKDHEAILRIFKNVKWPDLPIEGVEYNYDIAPLVDWPRHFPELWAYYLPAFLFYILDHRETEYYLPAFVETLATEENCPYPPERLSFLTEAQKRAVAVYLKLLLEEQDEYDRPAIDRIRPSFEQYWSNYLK
jgi:hypothetical protein